MQILPVPFRMISLALAQPYDCAGHNEPTRGIFVNKWLPMHNENDTRKVQYTRVHILSGIMHC